ncbi:lytic transglycosylase domain-containing protein [Labrys sp. 22185]|uniref:lytic transglycosylase domain-containing protein n=1 Tax=Labrys sp. 22185 TaxID=3453888 RepID=UPI003F86BC96
MNVRYLFAAALLSAAFACLAMPGKAQARQESLDEAICRLIETSARANDIPPELFTRLIWRESSFRPHVVSSAGAQGIAQFMPGTAAEWQLDDPFDPEKAIPASAAYLTALKKQFGNWGLALAAYNAGPKRLSDWLAGGRYLPSETRAYVYFITHRNVDDWVSGDGLKAGEEPAAKPVDCLAVVTAVRKEVPRLIEGPYAPFGVQLSGNFSKAIAIASYERAVKRFPAILAGRETLILGTRMAGRGRRAFYRVRLPARSMREASLICDKLHRAGGSCAVLRN